ncbi:MAG: DnaD domain protein [Dehalococcoidia bacterium]|nr:DnaD domain protein [Dehalococcoidia bacterium]
MGQPVFKGFPSRPEVTPLPNVFFTEVLPVIQRLEEAKVILHVFFLLSRRRGYPRFVSFNELKNDAVIVKGLHAADTEMNGLLKQALCDSVKSGVLLHVPVESGGRYDDLYFINNQAEKDTIAKITQGILKIPDIAVRFENEPEAEQASDIYNLYEQNIGMLTPILAEALQEAEHRYPAVWIQDAFKEALKANVRNWRYIHGILKRWEREGKKDGKSIRDYRKERDPDKYIQGPHGHVVRG